MPATLASRPSRSAAVIALVASLVALAVWAPTSQAAPVEADAVLLQTAPTPWDDTFNAAAMTAVFGAGWQEHGYDTVQTGEGTGGLFAPRVRFIWVEGSDNSTLEAAAFVTAHEAEFKSFVARGGRLWINSGSNQSLAIGYDGREVGENGPYDGVDAVAAVTPTHPIFLGPLPTATSFTGEAFAHGSVHGPGLTPLLASSEDPDPAPVVLAEYRSGSGIVVLGTLTAVQYEEPEDAAKALRTNLLTYLKPPPPPGPPAPAPVDTGKPTVKLLGLPKDCVERSFRFRIRTSDPSGVGVIRIKLNGKLLRKVNAKGKPTRLLKVKVPDAKLDHPGRYRLQVIARDSAGNVTKKAAKFFVCAER